jgi:hypothetical protein
VAPGEWGKLIGLDRIPEVRTLRQKITELCAKQGNAQRALVQISIGVCFCRARGFADFMRPAPPPKFPERWFLCRLGV